MSFCYLATPYRNYPAGRTAAYVMACRLAARLIRAGVSVYTPIGHTHPIAEHGGLDPVDYDLWMEIDSPFVDHASVLIVAMMESWEFSSGIAHEITQFTLAGKLIIYWDPATDLPNLDITNS